MAPYCPPTAPNDLLSGSSALSGSPAPSTPPRPFCYVRPCVRVEQRGRLVSNMSPCTQRAYLSRPRCAGGCPGRAVRFRRSFATEGRTSSERHATLVSTSCCCCGTGDSMWLLGTTVAYSVVCLCCVISCRDVLCCFCEYCTYACMFIHDGCRHAS